MVGRGTCVTEGDLGRSGGSRTPRRNRGIKVPLKGNAKNSGATEESERLIVATTPVERREEPRGRSQ
jgi:hypothetical protein